MRITWSESNSTGRPPIPSRNGGGTSGATTPGQPRASSPSGSAGQTSQGSDARRRPRSRRSCGSGAGPALSGAAAPPARP
jgi:hypothetical protein